MFESLQRTEPMAMPDFVADAVTIRLAPPMTRYSLRTKQPLLLETLLGIKVPIKIGVTEAALSCLGPDEWLLRAPMSTSIAASDDVAVSVVDISARAICLVVEGRSAAEVLMSGCPLDLEMFGVGRATRTIYETVEIILLRDSETCFHVEVWRSFAPWLWTALTNAANH